MFTQGNDLQYVEIICTSPLRELEENNVGNDKVREWVFHGRTVPLIYRFNVAICIVAAMVIRK